MNTPPTATPRRRMQDLLAIPERLRTEAEWDELHELEISLAPGNRADSGAQHPPRSNDAPRPPRQNNASAPPRPRPVPPEGGEAKKPFRKRQRKPPKPGGTDGTGGTGGPAGPAVPSESAE